MATGTGYASLFADRRFTLFLAQFAVADAGYAVYSIAVLWLAYQASGSLFVAGAVLAVEFGIYALSFLAGPYVDRAQNPRNILLVGYPLQGILAFAMAYLASQGSLTVPVLLGLVVVISFLWDFTYTASLAILPRIVPADRLFLANGLSSAVTGGNQVAGYAFGAVLILFVGPAGAMYLYAGLNVAAAMVAAALVVPRLAPALRSLKDDFVEGWSYLFSRAQRPLLQLSVFASMEAFFSTAFVLVITALAATVFADHSLSYGLLFAAFSFGGIAGGLWLGRANPRHRLAAILVGATAAEGVGLIVATAVAPALGVSIVAWFAVGAVAILFYTTQIVYIQATAPRPLVGRTITNTYAFRGGARAAGALVVGALGGVLAPLVLAGIVGTIFVVVAVVGVLAFPLVRKLSF